MKIAIPVNDLLALYKHNPLTAPKFAIYDIESVNSEVYFSLHSILENKLSKHKNHIFTTKEIMCTCDLEKKNNLLHKCEHYALLELIGDCSYLLADRYCDNTKKSMKQGGVILFRIPTIINKVEIAIKNFLIGGSIANKIKHIHHAS